MDDSPWECKESNMTAHSSSSWCSEGIGSMGLQLWGCLGHTAEVTKDSGEPMATDGNLERERQRKGKRRWKLEQREEPTIKKQMRRYMLQAESLSRAFLCDPMDSWPPGSSSPWVSPG